MGKSSEQDQLAKRLSRIGTNRMKFAQEIGVHTNTIYRWDKVPYIVDKYIASLEKIKKLEKENARLKRDIL